MTVLDDGPLRVTVAVRFAAVSSEVDASAMDKPGVVSSSVIVITPVASAIDALVGLDKTTLRVS